MPPTDTDLDAIRARWAAATQGRWMWYGNSKGKDVYLAAVGVRGGVNIVMDPVRAGMQGATVRFAVDGILRDPPLIRPESHNPWKIRGINHPDAIAIENAPTDVAALLAEVDRLRRVEIEARNAWPYFDPSAPNPAPEPLRRRLAAALGINYPGVPDAAD